MTDAKTFRAESWKALAAHLLDIQDDAPWLARGEEQDFAKVLPKLDRFPDCEWSKSLQSRLAMEDALLSRFRQRAAEFCTEVERGYLSAHFLEQSALARHYGVPTRLVDWTGSLWIAAYFAAQPAWARDGQPLDGRILLFDRHHLGKALDDENRRLCEGGWSGLPVEKTPPESLPTALWKLPFRHQGGETWLLLVPSEVQSLGEAGKLIMPAYFSGPKFSRLVAQEGCFTFANSPWVDHWHALQRLLETFASGGKGAFKLTIAAEAKLDVLRGLERMGIHGASIYPGLEGIGRNLSEFASYGEFDIPFRDLHLRQIRISPLPTPQTPSGAQASPPPPSSTPGPPPS